MTNKRPFTIIKNVNGRLFLKAGGVDMSNTTKEDILIVALHLFARDGYEAV